MVQNNARDGAGWSWDSALCGVVPPLISPLDAAGNPDGGAIVALVEHVLGAGCTGLFVLGGCGEGAWLTVTQRAAVIGHAAKAAGGRAPVLAGVMLPGTGAATEAARQAAGEGADAVVVGSPYYFGVDGDAQIRHIEAVIDAGGRPGLLYNIPQCTHHVLSAPTVAQLAPDTRVLGIKDSAGDFEAFQKLLAIKREVPRFRVLQGHEALLAPSLLQGGDGLVPGLGNVVPGLCVALCRAVARGDVAESRRLQGEVSALAELYHQGPWLAALKAACAALGLGNGRPAPPLLPASDTDRKAVEALLAASHVVSSPRAGTAR